MADEFKIADAFVEFSTKGDTAPEIDKQRQKAVQYQQQQEAAEKRLTAAQFTRMREVEAFQEKMRRAGMGNFSAQQWQQTAQRIEAEKRMKEAEQQQHLKENERQQKMNEAEARRAAADQKRADAEQKRHQAEIEQSRKVSALLDVRNQAQAHSQIVGAATGAFGSLPFVGGAGKVAQAAIEARQAAQSKAIIDGASKAEAAAIGRAGMARAGAIGVGVAGIAYGVEGAGKASPQALERMQYQADRLQAIVGQSFVPILTNLANGLEKFGNLVGGKGAQLRMPQFSEFAAIRDRLQIEALRGLSGGSGSNLGGGTGALIGGALGVPFGPPGIALGATTGTAIERGATWAYRSVMDVFK